MKRLIRMEKLGTTGKPVFWQAEVNDTKVTYSFGRVDGAIQSETITYTEGKNVGRANATTPAEQCDFDACVKARKKLDKDYKLTEGSLDGSGAKESKTEFSVPAPMLAKTFDDQQKRVFGRIYIQPKLDGNRCIVNRITGKMYSRTRKEIAHLPFISKAVMEATKDLPKDIIWVDGELFSRSMTFNKIQSIVRRAKNVDEKVAQTINYYIFDVMSSKPWMERRNIVKMIKGSSVIRVVEDMEVDAARLDELHDKYVKEGGYEGAIIRLGEYGYENKRSSGLIKYKKFKDAEFEVVGFTTEKHDKTLMGAVSLKMADSKTADGALIKGETFEARPAMPDKDKADIWENRAKFIGAMATVKFQDVDALSGIPRFPVLIKFRDPSDVPEKD